jgi:RNA recognition motif-containing protein
MMSTIDGSAQPSVESGSLHYDSASVGERHHTRRSPTGSAVRTVFVGGLSFRVSEQALGKFFSQFGRVMDLRIIENSDPLTGKSKGFGFVMFEDASVAEQLRKQGEVTFRNRRLVIAEAHENILPGEDRSGKEGPDGVGQTLAGEDCSSPSSDCCVDDGSGRDYRSSSVPSTADAHGYLPHNQYGQRSNQRRASQHSRRGQAISMEDGSRSRIPSAASNNSAMSLSSTKTSSTEAPSSVVFPSVGPVAAGTPSDDAVPFPATYASQDVFYTVDAAGNYYPPYGMQYLPAAAGPAPYASYGPASFVQPGQFAYYYHPSVGHYYVPSGSPVSYVAIPVGRDPGRRPSRSHRARKGQ